MDRARFTALLGAAPLFAGCAAHGRDSSTVRIGMVSDLGGLGDHSYNDSAYRGMLEARAQLHVAIAVLQSRSAADYQPNLMVFASKGYDQIVAVGYDQAPDLAEVAALFSQRRFALIDAVLGAPNVTSVTFKSAEASFLAGALAAMVTRTKTIAFLGGIDVPIIREFEVGYAAGAREIDPGVRVLVKYIGDFDDVPAGNELAELLYNQGADIVYAAAGKAGLGAIQAVRSRSGAYAIGVDADQDGLAPGKVLTSVLKRIDRSIVLLARLAVQKRVPPSRMDLGLKEGAVGLTGFRYTRAVVTPAKIAVLERLTAAIVAGRIAVPLTRAALETFARTDAR